MSHFIPDVFQHKDHGIEGDFNSASFISVALLTGHSFGLLEGAIDVKPSKSRDPKGRCLRGLVKTRRGLEDRLAALISQPPAPRVSLDP